MREARRPATPWGCLMASLSKASWKLANPTSKNMSAKHQRYPLFVLSSLTLCCFRISLSHAHACVSWCSYVLNCRLTRRTDSWQLGKVLSCSDWNRNYLGNICMPKHTMCMGNTTVSKGCHLCHQIQCWTCSFVLKMNMLLVLVQTGWGVPSDHWLAVQVWTDPRSAQAPTGQVTWSGQGALASCQVSACGHMSWPHAHKHMLIHAFGEQTEWITPVTFQNRRACLHGNLRHVYHSDVCRVVALCGYPPSHRPST